ncbi:3'(2'),5'-bisphosphate nucleotidase CysQ [Prochlorococcus sp. AH-716-M18]|nr:3'(2'),5'-bisphosphate nucleotidase CysQ [Prochlorococcus sp. AH-716-M18]
MLTELDINNLIDDLRIISWEAADVLIYYSQLLKNPNHEINIVKSKSNEDPVTIADLKVNEKIIKGINQIAKNFSWEILSEENVKIESNSCNPRADFLWVLDPLDGTRDFIQGTENYAMHLALHFKQKPLIGIVLIPKRNELWISNGKKVWCENRNGNHFSNNLSNKNNLDEMIIVTSKNHRNKTLENLIDSINFKKKITMGSIGCKIASILRGESDIYICLSLPGQTSPKDWDFAAPEAILKSAGGAITDLENRELSYNQPNYEQAGIIIASNNKQNHEKVCLQIKEIIKKFDLFPIN